MHIHLVGIAGSMTAPLAIALKKQGHLVTGSDQQKIYPPFNQQLKKAKISVNTDKINSKIDLAIIGSSFSSFTNTRQEFLEIKSQKIPYISATKYIAQNIAKTNSILVAGSYGKTTISAALSYLLKKASFKPAYMFGGQSLNRFPSLAFSNSTWSVIEADESINGLDTQAKFLYYPLKYLILTSAHWEHKDSYQNEAANFNSFKKLISKIPSDGCLIYNFQDPSLKALLPFAKCPLIPYTPTSHHHLLIGKHNQQNLGAVESMAKYLNISDQKIQASFQKFQGIKRRLELCAQYNNILFIDDFAQSANRIKASLDTIKDTYPQRKIKVFFEAHASFLQYQSDFKTLTQTLSQADDVVISRLKYNSRIPSSQRVTPKDFINSVKNCHYLPLNNSIFSYFQENLKNGDILVHFSSGGNDGLKTFKKIIHSFKSKANVSIHH